MLRNLNENDFDEYYRVRLQSLEEHPVAFSSMPKFFVNASKEMHMKLLADSGSDSSFFVKGYFEGQKLVGLLGVMPETRESVAHKASLWGFYVDPRYQKKMIGRQLLDAALADTSDDQRIKYLRLVVSVSCKRAIELFHKAGFQDYGLEREAITDGSAFYDQIYMQKYVS